MSHMLNATVSGAAPSGGSGLTRNWAFGGLLAAGGTVVEVVVVVAADVAGGSAGRSATAAPARAAAPPTIAITPTAPMPAFLGRAFGR